MAIEHLFQGSALNPVDAKGRVSVPAFLRSTIERRGDAKAIVLAKHEAYPCLAAYDRGYAATQHAKLERRYEKVEGEGDALGEYHRANMLAFGSTEDVPYDSTGRILLPPMMRRKGGIEDLAFFVGAGETFHVWNPRRFLEDPQVHPDMKDVCLFRLEERGIAL